MTFRVLRVNGHSMAPALQTRDLVLYKTFDGNIENLKVGNFVLADVPKYGLIVKKIIKISSLHIELSGLSPSSVASQHIGQIPHSSIVGKLVVKFFPLPFAWLA